MMYIVEKLRVKEKCKKENNDHPDFWAPPLLSFHSMFSFLPSCLQRLSLSALAPFSQPTNVVSSPPSQHSHHYGGDNCTYHRWFLMIQSGNTGKCLE